MSLFDSVKKAVSTREAAEHYGVRVGRNGMCRCPFHSDHDPSMKVDKRFHCFGCHADGDVVDFAARLFDLSPRNAALKIASDFGIAVVDEPEKSPKPKTPITVSDAERFHHQVSYCYHELAAYRNQLVQWKEEFAPQTPDDDLHPCFLEAIRHLDEVEYQLDVLLSGAEQEKQEVVRVYLQDQKTKQEGNMDPINKTPVYYETAAYARENGELELFRLSHRTNIACKNDIQDAISRHFDGMHLDKETAKEVLDQYGAERVSIVLAATVQYKSWDGRFSSSNKDWAFSVHLPEGQSASGLDRRSDYIVDSHPAVLDGFIWQARREIRERQNPTVKKDAIQEAAPAAKAAKRKTHDIER